MDRMNDSEVFNYIDSKFHSADYGTSYVDEDWYKADEVDADKAKDKARIQELEGAIGRWKIEEKAWNETETQLRKALEEIQVEVRKPERIPRDIEKWLKRADKRTKLKKIDDIATEALGGEKKEEENDKR